MGSLNSCFNSWCWYKPVLSFCIWFIQIIVFTITFAEIIRTRIGVNPTNDPLYLERWNRFIWTNCTKMLGNVRFKAILIPCTSPQFLFTALNRTWPFVHFNGVFFKYSVRTAFLFAFIAFVNFWLNDFVFDYLPRKVFKCEWIEFKINQIFMSRFLWNSRWWNFPSRKKLCFEKFTKMTKND